MRSKNYCLSILIIYYFNIVENKNIINVVIRAKILWRDEICVNFIDIK